MTSPVLTHETCDATLVRYALINKKHSYHLQKQRALSAVETVHSAHFLFVWYLLLVARLVWKLLYQFTWFWKDPAESRILNPPAPKRTHLPRAGLHSNH